MSLVGYSFYGECRWDFKRLSLDKNSALHVQCGMSIPCRGSYDRAVLTGHAGVVDLHVDGVRATAHQVRVADVYRTVIASTALNTSRQVRQLDTVTGRRPIPTSRVRRRHPVEHLDHPD